MEKLKKTIKKIRYEGRKKVKKELKRKKSKEEKGITLIALVITIIILLILAGVTLNAALSENGLFKKAKYAAEEYNQKAIEEEIQLMLAEQEIDAANSNGKADITDVLEKVKESEGAITEDDINKFNEKYLKDYGEDQQIQSVDDANELKEKIEKNPNGFYVQTGDITGQTLDGPIGTEDTPFTGVYNGNTHTINNLTITATEDNTGMFGVNEGTVKDVKIGSCTVNSSNYKNVGAIVGLNRGLIENCTIENGNITSDEFDNQEDPEGERFRHVGGVCGRNEGGTIRGCINKSTINTNCHGVGGICGLVPSGVVEDCFNEGSITGRDHVGGIAGNLGAEENDDNAVECIRRCKNSGQVIQNVSTTNEGVSCGGICANMYHKSVVEECVNLGNVCGEAIYVGGVCAVLRHNSVIRFCRNTGNVKCNDFVVGGITGSTSEGGLIEACYSVGDVSDKGRNGDHRAGCILGGFYHGGKCVDCYYVSSSDLDGIGYVNDSEDGCIKISTENLKGLIGVDGFEGKFVKDDNGSFPLLYWEK